MAKKANPHPHVSWRDGRPRFQPGKELRTQGYKGTDLRWPADAPADWKPISLQPGDANNGRWFTKGEAVDWSAEFQRVLSTKRAETEAAKPRPRGKAVAPRKVATYTVERLIDEWTNPKINPKFRVDFPRCYSPNTITDYKQKMNVLAQHDPDLWISDVRSLDQPTMRMLFDDMWATRGLATAKGTMLVLSSAISWGMLRGKVKLQVNPALKLRMETPEPRVRFGTRREIDALIAAADRVGLPEVGDMIVLGVWTGQRQGDRLLLVDKGLLNGRRIFRQSKTGAIVAIKDAPQLEARLVASAERRRKANIINKHVILFEKTWQPFKKYHYRHVFADVRDAAIVGEINEEATLQNFKTAKAMDAAIAMAEKKLRSGQMHSDARIVYKFAPCPSLKSFMELDLRDTAVTWLALAGATIPEICSITGHTMVSATRILKHYLARHPEMADSAIGKMIAWYDADGETEIGF
ncbi:hypothetical protein M1D80_11945 [Phyllobacteriaceae bacterium JZ32]